MEKLSFEIVIRCKNGVYTGGSIRQEPLSTAQPITLAKWPEVCSEINKASLQAVEDLTAEKANLVGERDLAVAELKEHQAISDGLVQAVSKAIEASDTPALYQILAEATLFGKARERVKLEAELAEKQREMDALAAKIAAANA